MAQRSGCGSGTGHTGMRTRSQVNAEVDAENRGENSFSGGHAVRLSPVSSIPEPGLKLFHTVLPLRLEPLTFCR
jgi:hypothetical protein